MKEELITYDTAVLAKEKGFNIYGFQNYNRRGNLKHRMMGVAEYPAPTQALLQRWLREEHKILVESLYSYSANDYIPKVGKLNEYQDYIIYTNMSFKTYEEALEIGLQEALKLIEI